MFKIVTDSAANISPHEARKLGVQVIPQTIVFGTKEYRDGVDLTPDEFYEKMETEFPRSSQINVAAFDEVFAKARQEGQNLFVILLSSVLSGTYDSAVAAKQDGNYENVYVYDSKGASVMEKLLVVEALRNADKTGEEIAASLDGIRARMRLYAAVDTLEYLHKGGRLKKGVALVGKIIDLKPVITISPAGKVELYGKAMGYRRAIRTIRQAVLSDKIDENYPVYYIYSKTKARCEELAAALHPDRPEYTENANNLCSVIGVHIGPGGAGLCYVAKE